MQNTKKEEASQVGADLRGFGVSLWEKCRISLTPFPETCVCVGVVVGWENGRGGVGFGGVGWRLLASRNVPGDFSSFLPQPTDTEWGGWTQDYGRQSRDKAWVGATTVRVCVCSQQDSGLLVLQRTDRKCEVTGPRKRMPSPDTGVAKGLDRVCVCVCVWLL